MSDLLQGIVPMTISTVTMHIGLTFCFSREETDSQKGRLFPCGQQSYGPFLLWHALVPGTCSLNRTRSQEWCSLTTWIVWSWRLA